jgi:hypothetical protein
MTMTAKVATDLVAGDVIALPFNKCAEITGVHVGRLYVNLVLAGGRKTRYGLYEEVLIEDPDPEHLEGPVRVTPASTQAEKDHAAWLAGETELTPEVEVHLARALTDAALAHRLRHMLGARDGMTSEERTAVLEEAARRIEGVGKYRWTPQDIHVTPAPKGGAR